MHATHPVRVLLLLQRPSLQEALLRHLDSNGFDAVACQNAAELFARAGLPPPTICVLEATHAVHNAQTVAAQLQRHAALRIVVLTPPGASLARTEHLLAGADVCLDTPPDVAELCATLLALARRQSSTPSMEWAAEAASAHPAAPGVSRNDDENEAKRAPHQRWHLADDSWQLVAPNGQAVRLSPNERTLLLILTASSGKPVTRDTLVAGLWATTPAASAPEGPRLCVSRINMLISRLRKKALQTGFRLPLQSQSRRGYLIEYALITNAMAVAASAATPSKLEASSS